MKVRNYEGNEEKGSEPSARCPLFSACCRLLLPTPSASAYCSYFRQALGALLKLSCRITYSLSS